MSIQFCKLCSIISNKISKGHFIQTIDNVATGSVAEIMDPNMKNSRKVRSEYPPLSLHVTNINPATATAVIIVPIIANVNIAPKFLKNLCLCTE